MRYWLVLAPIIILSFLATSCGDKGVPPKPVSFIRLQIVSGNNQSPKSAAFLPDSFLVRVTTSTGVPVPDIEVTYEQITAISGGYFTWNTNRTTDDNGYAKNKYYADELVGLDSIKVTATGVDDSVVYYIVNVLPEDPDTIIYVSGDNQLAVGGQKVPDPCVVKIADRFGNAIPDYKVWFKTDSRCLVETDSSTNQTRLTDSAFTYTDANGEASSEWILTVNPTPYIGGWPNNIPTSRGLFLTVSSIGSKLNSARG